MSSRKGYPIIGGPLSGSYAKYADMQSRIVCVRDQAPTSWNPNGYAKGQVLREGGKFGAEADQYIPYNCASRGGGPSMIWLHKDLLP